MIRTLAVVPFPYSRENADEWVASAAKQLADGDAYQLAITGTDGGTELLVGGIGLRLNRAMRTAELGYWVGRAYWGHGVASEAAKRLVRWGLANLDIGHVEASVATENGASMAVLRRIGFRHVGDAMKMSVATLGGKRFLGALMMDYVLRAFPPSLLASPAGHFPRCSWADPAGRIPGCPTQKRSGTT